MKEPASNKEWKKWGEMDPLFGVASWQDKNRDGSNPWTDQEFYQLGKSDWRDFARHWQMYGVNWESCLEVGCGAGRITMQLALHFGQVHAIDVSEKMIEYAKRSVPSPSVVFHVSNGVDIPLPDQSVCSVFSTHVFQHFESLSVADRCFAEIARTLTTNGTLMLHLPIHSWPSSSRVLRMIYGAQKTMGDARARGRRLLMHYGIAKPFMRRLSYPIEYLFDVLPRHGLDDIELAVFATRSNSDPHSFVFARRKTCQSLAGERQ